MPATLLKNTFSAWIDQMPGSTPKLIVAGEVEVPTSGWQASLKRAVPQGINPNIILLDLEAKAPTGNVLQVVSKIPVRYEESPPNVNYTQATIRDNNESLTIGVKTTS